MTTTAICKLSLVAQRQQRRALGDILMPLLLVASIAANLGNLLSI